jgi:hypothetical protein
MKNWDWLVPVSDSDTKVGSSSLFPTMHYRGESFVSVSDSARGGRSLFLTVHRGGILSFSDSALEGGVICLYF